MFNFIYLAGKDNGTQEDTLASPFLQLNVEMWFGTVDINKRCEYDWDGDFSPFEDVCDESCKGSVLWVT